VLELYNLYILVAKCSAFVHPWAGRMSKMDEARKVFQMLMGEAL